LIDGLVLVLVFAFIAILRYRSSQQENPALRRRLLYLFLSLSLIAGTATLARVLSIPPDPKNAWLLGYSKTRIVIMGGVLAVLLALLYYVIYLSLRPDYRGRALERLDKFRRGKWGKVIRTTAVIGVVIGLCYQVVFSFNPFPDYRDFFDRLTPLLAWMLAESVLLLLLINGWRGRLTHPLRYYGRPMADFFSNYPAYIYLLVAIGLMVFAQLLDQGYLVLPPSITALTHNSYGPIEELSKFMAAVLLFLSAFLVMAPGERAEEVTLQ
jgi:predicted secreted protein